jgi:hypothetical protein
VDSLAVLVVLAFLLGPPIFVWLLKRTRLFWLPGTGLIAWGVYTFETADPVVLGGPAVIGNGLDLAFAKLLLFYGVICLAFGVVGYGRSKRPATPPQPQAVGLPAANVVPDVPVGELPPATVVSGVPKS